MSSAVSPSIPRRPKTALYVKLRKFDNGTKIWDASRPAACRQRPKPATFRNHPRPTAWLVRANLQRFADRPPVRAPPRRDRRHPCRQASPPRTGNAGVLAGPLPPRWRRSRHPWERRRPRRQALPRPHRERRHPCGISFLLYYSAPFVPLRFAVCPSAQTRLTRPLHRSTISSARLAPGATGRTHAVDAQTGGTPRPKPHDVRRLKRLSYSLPEKPTSPCPIRPTPTGAGSPTPC